MGAPAAINYSAPRTRAREIAPSAGNININQALGLRSSPYSGLQQVGKQNLYYGKGGLYESYSPEPVRFLRNMLPYGVQQTYRPTGLMPSTPSLVNFGGMSYYSGGWNRSGGDVEGTIRIGNQAFRPSTNIPAGFIKVGDTYEPSVAYALSKSMPNIKAQPNKMFTTVTGYQPASRNLLSNLNVDSDSGAGQYLGSGLLGSGLNFGMSPRQINTNRYEPTITSNKEGFNGYGNILDAKTSFGMPIGSPDSMNKIQTLGDFLNTFTFKPRIPIGNSTELDLANMPFYFGKPIGNPSEGNE